jgi:hypothetical protein
LSFFFLKIFEFLLLSWYYSSPVICLSYHKLKKWGPPRKPNKRKNKSSYRFQFPSPIEAPSEPLPPYNCDWKWPGWNRWETYRALPFTGEWLSKWQYPKHVFWAYLPSLQGQMKFKKLVLNKVTLEYLIKTVFKLNDLTTKWRISNVNVLILDHKMS